LKTNFSAGKPPGMIAIAKLGTTHIYLQGGGLKCYIIIIGMSFRNQ